MNNPGLEQAILGYYRFILAEAARAAETAEAVKKLTSPVDANYRQCIGEASALCRVAKDLQILLGQEDALPLPETVGYMEDSL